MVSNTIYHYVYRITNLVEKKHYYGKRSSKCDPKLDLGIKYFSSSKDKDFKADQKNNPQNYKYKIIGIFPTAELALSKEIKFHFKLEVDINPNFYNRSKQTSSKFYFDSTGIIRSEEQKEKISKAHKGRKHSSEHTENWKISMIGKTNKGKPMSEEQKEKISKALKGRKHTVEHIEKYSANRKANNKIKADGLLVEP